MWNNVGIIRNETGLLKAKKEIQKLKKEFKNKEKCSDFSEYEYRNMLITSGDKGIIYEFDPEDNLIMKYIIKSNKNRIYRVDKITFNNYYFKG